MELLDLPIAYLAAAFALWLLVGGLLIWRSEFIAVGILALFFCYQVIVFVVLGGRAIPFGQITLLFFGPLLLVSVAFRQKAPVLFVNLVPYLTMALAMVVSNFWNGLDFWQLKSAMIPLFIAILVYLAVPGVREFRVFIITFGVLLAVNNIIAGLQYAGFDKFYLPIHVDSLANAAGIRRGIGIVGHFMETGMLSGGAIPIAVLGFLGSKNKLPKALWGALFVTGIAGLGFSGLRAALMSSIVGTVIALFLAKGVKSLRYLIGVVAAVAIIVVAVPVFHQASQGLIDHSSKLDSSALARPKLAMMGLELWTTSPIFGAGTDGLSRMVSGKIGKGNAHNSYVSALSDYGLLGFVSFAAILVLSIVRLRQTARRLPDASYLMNGMTGALVSFYIAILVHPIEDMAVFWLFPAIATASARFAAAAAENPAAPGRVRRDKPKVEPRILRHAPEGR